MPRDAKKLKGGVVMGFTIMPDVHAWLVAEAERQERSLAGMIRTLLREAMEARKRIP